MDCFRSLLDPFGDRFSSGMYVHTDGTLRSFNTVPLKRALSNGFTARESENPALKNRNFREGRTPLL
jgi:hypothetical protein